MNKTDGQDGQTGIRETVRLVASLMRRERGLVLWWLLSLLAASVAMLAVPLGVRRVIDHGFNTPSNINIVFAGLVGIALLLALTTAARLYFVSHLGDRVVGNLRKNLFGQLIRRDLDFHHQRLSAELLSRLTTDSEYLRIMVSTALSVALRSLITLVGATVMLFGTSPVLAAMAAIVIPVAVVPIILVSRRLRTMSRESVDQMAKATTVAAEVLMAVRAVKEFAREDHEECRYADAVDRASASARRRVVAQTGLAVTAITLVFSGIIGVLWLGARAVTAGEMSPGTLGQFVLYAVIGGMAVAELLETWSTIQRSVGAVGRIAALYELTPSPVDATASACLQVQRGALTFEGVRFAYASSPDKPILEDFNLEVAPGRCTALVGPSGAGKSTLFALLLRLHEPQRGRILVDGVDLRQCDARSVRELIAIVPQAPAIFAMSARENIRYGRLDATDKEVEAAARAADANVFIRNLPGGYDEPLGERGGRLSGGQLQRIAIARAMLKDAPILLLDEATSALDAGSERAVHDALKRLMAGRTTLVIAHRLSTVLDAAEIVVMEGGQVINRGSHTQLLAGGGLYADFARMQQIANGNADAIAKPAAVMPA